MAMDHEGRSDQHCGRAEGGNHLLPGRLERQVCIERHPRALIVGRLIVKDLPARSNRTKGDEFAHALHCVHDKGIEATQFGASLAAKGINLAALEHRCERRINQEWQQYECCRPGYEGESDQNGQWYQERHHRRRHDVREEVFDRLDVLCPERNEIARAPLQKIGRRKLFQGVVEIDAHLGEQSVGHVVGAPRFIPLQKRCQRYQCRHPHEIRTKWRARLDCRHCQSAERADADQGIDASHAGSDGQDQLLAPWPDQFEQRSQGPNEVRPAAILSPSVS